jgi:hypothetical protein
VTRGLHEVLTGHPVAALRLNVLLLVVVPGVLYGYAAWALPRLGGPKLPTIRLTQRNLIGVIAVLVLWSALRNLPWGPFPALSSLS